MEVLVALGIFALGFTAVAAVFPTAALMQKRTADDIGARHASDSARAITEATKLTYAPSNNSADLYFYHNDPVNPSQSDVRPFNGGDGTSLPELNDFWSLNTRSFGSNITDPQWRSFYWIPLICDTAGNETSPSWKLIVFVLKRDEEETYSDDDPSMPGYTRSFATTSANGWASTDDVTIPSVKRYTLNSTSGSTFELSDTKPGVTGQQGIEARVNDRIVDNTGKPYTVRSVSDDGMEISVESSITTSPTHIWFAPPADDGNSTPDSGDISPTMQLLDFTFTASSP